MHEPRSSSAVRESRFTAADLEEREVEGFAVADATFCLAPFIGTLRGGRKDAIDLRYNIRETVALSIRVFFTTSYCMLGGPRLIPFVRLLKLQALVRVERVGYCTPLPYPSSGTGNQI